MHMYVDGQPQKVKVLFDQLLWPIDTKKHPWRVGAGGGTALQGRRSMMSASTAACFRPTKSARLRCCESIDALARMPLASDARLRSRQAATVFPRDRRARGTPDVARQARTAPARNATSYLNRIPTVMVMKERERPRETFILKRGAYDAQGEKVSPAFAGIPEPDAPEWPKNRLGLARWLVDRDNPLTARSPSTASGQMLFGTGWSRRSKTSARRASGRSTRICSTGWQSSSWIAAGASSTAEDDGDERRLSAVVEASRRSCCSAIRRTGCWRADRASGSAAEMIRDQALAVFRPAGRQGRRTAVKPYQPAGLMAGTSGRARLQGGQGEACIAAACIPIGGERRAAEHDHFDSPTRETCVVRENRTNTPLQALDLMNDVAYVEAARKLAERMIAEGGSMPAQRIDRGFELVLAVPRSRGKRAAADSALSKFAASLPGDRKQAEAFASHGKSPRNATSRHRELAAYTGVASIILNLDEAITKQ